MELKTVHIYLAIICGILLALPWFFYLPGFFMFFALIPLLYIEHYYYDHPTKYSSAKVFLYTHVAFLIWNSLALWWLLKFSVLAGVLVIILNSLCYTIPFWFFHIVRKKFSRPISVYMLVFFWCAFEFIYLNVSWALPGLHLGNVFYKDILFIQWYEYTGILGGTCWILVVNILFYRLINHLIYNGLNRRAKLHILKLAFIIIVPGVISVGLYNHYESAGEKSNVVVVQPNIDPYKEKFNGMTPGEQLDRILNITKQAIKEEPMLIVCPETALADTVWFDSIDSHPHIQRIRHFLRAYPQAKMIIGAELYEIKNADTAYGRGNKSVIYNAALQVDTSKNTAIYIKTKLIPGVEKHLFPGLAAQLAPGMEEMFMPRTGGKNNQIFPGGTIPLICYESLYGKYTSDYTTKGAELLVIITNDGWFGDTHGYRYHLGIARLRAIESRRSIARSANTGVSAFIDPKGRIIKFIQWNEAGAISSDIQMHHHLTFYAKHGDYIGWFCVFMAALFLIMAVVLYVQARYSRINFFFFHVL